MSTPTETHTTQPVITFTEPMPGLGDYTSFHLVALDEMGAMYSLRTDENPDRLVPLAAALVFHPDFTPVLDDATCEELGLTDSAEAAVFLVVNAAEELANATVNLIAPVVINVNTGIGKQVVLNGPDSDLRAPLIKVVEEDILQDDATE